MKHQKLVLVTGGARSGKSSFGESLLMEVEGKVLYIATAQAFDEEMKDRIKKHQTSRPQDWLTHEGYKSHHKGLMPYVDKVRGIILDCATIMTTNLMLEEMIDWDQVTHEKIDEIEKKIFKEFEELIKSVKTMDATTVIITNEVGLGIVPIDRMTRIFRDIAGRVNQYLGREADEVYFVTCGIPNRIK